MSEEKTKSAKLFAFWLFGTVLIVFAAITAYILMSTGRTITMGQALRAGLPIWGITAVVAVIIFAGYSFYSKRQA